MKYGPPKPPTFYFYIRSNPRATELLAAIAYGFSIQIFFTEEDCHYTRVNMTDGYRPSLMAMQWMEMKLREGYWQQFPCGEIPHPDYAELFNAGKLPSENPK